MSKNSRKKLEITFLILFLIVFMAVNFVFDRIDFKHDNIDLSDNWSVTINDERYDDVNLSTFRFKIAGKGDVLTLSSILPNNMPNYPLLCIFVIHSELNVNIAGETVYQFGQERYKENKLIGYGYHFIPLSPEMAGQTLTINLRVSENSAFSSFEVPKIANSQYFIRNYSVRNLLVLLVLIFLIVFGLLLLIISFVYTIKYHNFYKLLYISMFSICIGCWSLCSRDLIILFTYNPLIKAYIEYISLYMVPFFVFGYFSHEAIYGGGRLRKYTYLTILIAQATFIILAIALQLSNIVHLPALLTVCHALIAVMLIYILVIFIYDIIKKQLKTSPALLIGFSIMVLYFFMDLVRFNIQKYWYLVSSDHYTSKIYIGVFIFIFSLFIDFCSSTITTLYKNAESETLEKMAYTDYLTGLHNRRKLEEIMDDIDRGNTAYAVVAFDLNDLKKANDTLGHEEGDKYIKKFGQILKKTFQNYGLVGRIGGDEFQVVIRNAENLDIESLIVKMNEYIKKVNDQNTNWEMSTAYGFCFAYDPDVKSIRDASKIADKRMYKKKIEMKKNAKAKNL